MLKCFVLGVCACGYLGWRVLGRRFGARGAARGLMRQPHGDYLAKRPEVTYEPHGGAPEVDLELQAAAVLDQDGAQDVLGEHYFDCAVEHNPADLEAAAAAG